MSRFRRVVHGVTSGYLLLAFTAAYSIITVPLTLHYLPTREFALWALMASITGYLLLIDLGMSSSIARLLIDHKDDKKSGAYGGLIKTGWLVLATQGLIAFAIGWAFAPVFSRLLAIEPDMQQDFVGLLRWQTLSIALGFGLRIFNQMLVAHQRIDLYNYTQIAALTINLSVLWLFLHQKCGVFSLAWSSLCGSLSAVFLALIACAWLKYFPARGGWGRVSWEQFRELFGYGKDTFLVALGTQLIMASQTMIITRRLGLEVAAVWAVGTKAFTLASQLVWRLSDSAGPAFAEMIVRQEYSILQRRYRMILVLTGSFCAYAAVGFAVCNSLFVTVWTHGKIWWSPAFDPLLAVWMIVMGILHMHNGFVLITKQIAFMRFIYFIEGVVFVICAYLTTKSGGLSATLLCSILCSTFFSGAYGIHRIANYFGVPKRTVAWEWLAPSIKVLALLSPIGLVAWLISHSISDPALALVFNFLVTGLAGFYILGRFGLPDELIREFITRAPARSVPLLKRFFAVSAR